MPARLSSGNGKIQVWSRVTRYVLPQVPIEGEEAAALVTVWQASEFPANDLDARSALRVVRTALWANATSRRLRNGYSVRGDLPHSRLLLRRLGGPSGGEEN